MTKTMGQLDKNKEKIFYIALFMAFISHCSLFFGGAMGVNEDNFSFYREELIKAELGRWFADVLRDLGIVSSYRVPAWAGIFVILALAATCMIVLSIIKIRSKAGIYLTIAVLVTFPTLAYSNGYLYDSALYTLSLLFAAMAVWITNKWKYGCFGGAVCLMLSLALYQAWLAFAVTLVIVYILIRMKEEDIAKENIIAMIIKNAGMGALGTVLYLLSVKIYNVIFHVTLSSYKGLDAMGNIQLSELPGRISNCYQAFFDFVRGNYYAMPKMIIWLNYLVLAIIFLLSSYYFIVEIKRKNFLKAFLFAGFTVILPIGMCFMEIAYKTDTLSVYANCMIYILLIKYCDIRNEDAKSVVIRGGYKEAFRIGTYIIGIIFSAFLLHKCIIKRYMYIISVLMP